MLCVFGVLLWGACGLDFKLVFELNNNFNMTNKKLYIFSIDFSLR